MGHFRVLLMIALVVTSSRAIADIWTEPNPMRREALLEGRSFDYNTESFLHRLSFRQLSGRPYSDQDGLSGTVGSTRSDEFYVDMFLQKSLLSDDDRHVAFVRMQRSEDFDGHLDRQIVGYGHRLGDWRLALAGDVRGDKAEIDVQLELQWQPDTQRLVRLALIRPDAFFNDKDGTDGDYLTTPTSYFVHARMESQHGWALESAVTHSPAAQFNDERRGVNARGQQIRAMLQMGLPSLGPLMPQLRVESERSRRSFDFSRNDVPEADRFERRMHSVRLTVEHRNARLNPTAGLYHLRLHEQGWFGDRRRTSGLEARNELLAFVSVMHPLSERWALEPAIYAGRARVIQTQSADDGTREVPNANKTDAHGKLALPFRYTIDAARGGVLTLNPTLRLHRAAFGGGNVQVHWPF